MISCSKTKEWFATRQEDREQQGTVSCEPSVSALRWPFEKPSPFGDLEPAMEARLRMKTKLDELDLIGQHIVGALQAAGTVLSELG